MFPGLKMKQMPHDGEIGEPLLSAVLCGDKDNAASVTAVKSLRRNMPANSEVIFSGVEDGNLAKARNEGLARARGEYVSFLVVGECYATSQVAEILARTARVNGEVVYGGSGGLSSYVFRRDWILSRGLRFYGERNGGELFLCMALHAAGDVQFPPRPVISGRALPIAPPPEPECACAEEGVRPQTGAFAGIRDDVRSVLAAAKDSLGEGQEAFICAIRKYLLRGKVLQFRRLMDAEDVPDDDRARDAEMLREIVKLVDADDHAIESCIFLPYAMAVPDDACQSADALREFIAGACCQAVCVGGCPETSTLRRTERVLHVVDQCDAVVVSNAIAGGSRRIVNRGQMGRVVTRPFSLLLRKDFADAVASTFQGGQCEKAVFAWKALLRARCVYLVADVADEGFDFLSEVRSEETALAMHRALYEADRLDLASVFYSLLHEVVVAGGVPAEVAGSVLNRTGYAYFVSSLLQKDLVNGVARDLCLWSNLAAGNGVCLPFEAGQKLVPRREPAEGDDDSPDLSIVMPVYNAERYLVRSIESVRKQTGGKWELICVDDGSVDGSARILDAYAAADSRIHVHHKPNSGVSDSRNLGLGMSNGRYVAFLDADDWYEPTLVEDVMQKCNGLDLDVCFFDYRCRNYATLAESYHFWTFAHIGKHWGNVDRVFASFDLGKWWYYGSMCQMAWKKSFLVQHNAKFPRIPLGEDFTVLSGLFPFIERGFIVSKTLYNYQRGSSTSAVSRFGAEKGPAFVQKYETLLDLYREVYLKCTDPVACKKFVGRLLGEILYDCSVAPAALEWMRAKGRAGFGLDDIDETYVLDVAHVERLGHLLNDGEEGNEEDVSSFVPARELALMRKIEARRSQCPKKDLYIVAAQLTSSNDEAIDGWSFFEYLKSIGVPACFVVWKRHKRAREFRQAYPGDIIEISDPSAGSYDFLHACKDALVRAKAVAVEWTVANPAIGEWLSRLDGCVYTFLQHGLTYNPPRPVHRKWWSPFNLINFCSERERDMVLPAIGAGEDVQSVVSGMMRWDLLKDESSCGDKVVLVMLTWRPTFNISPEAFWKSAYFNGIKALLSQENVDRLRRSGLRVVLSLHHSLNRLDRQQLDFGPNVETVSTQEVSAWIRKAACLITDFSSVSFDFWYMRKPVVYWVPDRFDETLTVPDRDKVGMACRFLATFVNEVRSADEAVDLAVRYAGRDFRLEPEVVEKIRPFFSEGTGFRKRVYEAVEGITTERDNQG